MRQSQELLWCWSRSNLRQQPKRFRYVFSFEQRMWLDFRQNRNQKGPASDHQITHAGTTISQIASTEQTLQMLKSCSGGRALREGKAGPDIEPVPVLLLPDYLEVNTSITVEESRDV